MIITFLFFRWWWRWRWNSYHKKVKGNK